MATANQPFKKVLIRNLPKASLFLVDGKSRKSMECDCRVMLVEVVDEKRRWKLVISKGAREEIERRYMEKPVAFAYRDEPDAVACRVLATAGRDDEYAAGIWIQEEPMLAPFFT